MPPLLIPPAKVETPVTSTPVWFAVMVPVFEIVPVTTEPLKTLMPIPLPEVAVMVPALAMPPLTVLLLMAMPVGIIDGGVMVPLLVLVTLPLTVEFRMLMQLMAAELLTGPKVPPLSLMVQIGFAEAGPPAPTSAPPAIKELVAKSQRKRAALPSRRPVVQFFFIAACPRGTPRAPVS